MNYLKRGLAILALPLLLTVAACSGEQVTIQPGEVAKQLTGAGLEQNIRTPSSFRMDYCGQGQACARIVRVQVGRSTAEVKIDSLLLPRSNVDVTNITVGIQWRVRNTRPAQERIFAEVVPQAVPNSSTNLLISSATIWSTYGQRKVQAAIADAFNDLTVDEAMAIGTQLSSLVRARVEAALADTPIEVTELDVSNTDVSEAVMVAKRALFAIQDSQARRIAELRAFQSVEEQRQAFQRLRARNDEEIARLLGMTPAQYMCLKTMERLADAADDNRSTVVINGDCGLSTTTARTATVPLRPAAN